MKKTNMCKCISALVLVLLFACPFPAMAQQAVSIEQWTPADQAFRPEELDQMLAPIALYPDALLAQVLASATYPQGIVDADRFIKDNPRVSIQTLIDIARDTDWSPSVKAMLQFPDVLAMMAQHLDWTAKLGDAFLDEQRDVMDSIQRLRQMAYQQGRLMTTREVVVRFDPQTQMIFIEPANPQMVYVPVYDSEVVYGTWRYPDYPPYRYYYPGYSPSSTLSFLAGILVGAEMGWGGWDFDWQHHRSNVRVGNYNTFVNRSYANPQRFQISSAGGTTVAYDTRFRKAAGYRNDAKAQPSRVQQALGLTAARPGVPVSRGTQQVQARSSVPTVGVAGVSAKRPQASKAALKGGAKVSRPAAAPSVTAAVRPTENINVFSDVGNGGNARAASFRGQVSLQNSRSAGVSKANGASQGSSAVSKGSRPEVSQVGGGSRGGAKPAEKAATKSDGKEKRQ